MHVWSKERGLRKLKEGVSLEQYQAKYPSAIEVDKPSIEEVREWVFDDCCFAVDGCPIEPDGVCEHGYPSWLIAIGII